MPHRFRSGGVARLRQAAIGLSALGISVSFSACSQPSETNINRAIVENVTAAAPVTGGNEAQSGAATAPTPPRVPTPSPAAPLPTSTGTETLGGDGSAIQLSALTGGDIDAAKLEGELACSFAGRDGKPLLHAAGNVGSSARAFGVVKVLDSVETISAPGGFNGMVKGATFAGRGKTVRIKSIGSAPKEVSESPPVPATLSYQRADGASRSYPGTWTCGP
jgi:hypothetical protein